MPTTYNKVTAGGQTLIDLSQDTVTDASHIVTGHTGHLADGTQVAGTGGGSVEVEEKQVNFIDFDGTILHSYTKAEANALTELPSNPIHTGLTAQGWNWTLAQIKSQLTADPDGHVWVGQMYVTTSGKTEIDIELKNPRLAPYLGIAVNGTVDVDWGDGSTHSTVTGTSLSSQKRTQHTYSAEGAYTIKISVTSGKFAFYGSSGYMMLGRNSSTGTDNWVYAERVNHVRLGTNVEIGAYGLYQLGLKSITMPSSITAIGNYAFYYDYEITALVVPSSVTILPNYLLEHCYGFKRLAMPPSVTTINTYAMANAPAIESITIPYTVTSFGTYAFNYCTNIRHIFIPSGVTSLNVSNAFSQLRTLTSVTVPSSVTSIGSNVFAECRGLGAIHFKRTTPPTLGSTNAFTNVPSDCVFYVPYSADHSVLNAYKTASNWSTYASRMQEEAQ